jgi:hypothetical protein
MRRDRCSRHQWLHSRETSRVYVRYSCTQSTQADVRSAVPRTTPATRNLISASRADEASSREYAPQTWSPAHPCKCLSADGDFGGPLSHTLCAHRRWDGIGCVQHVWDCSVQSEYILCSRNQKQLHLLCIYTRDEGGQWTVTVAIKATVTVS